MNPPPDNPIEKANDIGVEALKQIITLASAILALTITFLKDALGDARSQALGTFLVPLSWLLLVSSIWVAWASMVEVAKTLGSMGSPLRFVFDREVDNITDISPELKEKIRKTRKWSVRAQYLFLAGIASLTVFALINYNLFFTSTPTPPSQNSQPTLTVIVSPTHTQTIIPTPTPMPQQKQTPNP